MELWWIPKLLFAIFFVYLARENGKEEVVPGIISFSDLSFLFAVILFAGL